MFRQDETNRCVGCGAEIDLSPVMKDGRAYCCLDCSQGLKCNCGERMEMDDRPRTSDVDAGIESLQ